MGENGSEVRPGPEPVERQVTSISLHSAERKALDILQRKFKRQSRADTIRFLIWTALEQNVPEEYDRLQEEVRA